MDTWNVSDIPDLTGKKVVVTGGNSGLGYEAVQIFAEKNAFVILTCRTMAKGRSAVDKIKNENIKKNIRIMILDLSDLESVNTFVELFKSEFKTLDILLNNAGIMTTPYGLTKDGLEQQSGVNHFGHFALTAKLFPLLKNTDNSRIVNISSLAHKSGDMDFNNFLFENGSEYTPMKAYGRSKLSNLHFTYELNRRLESSKTNIRSFAAHPGGSNTNLARSIEDKFWFKFFKPLLQIFTQSAYNGCLPGVRACLDTTLNGGEYIGPNGFMEVKGKPVIVQSNKASHNSEDSKQLWDLSEKLTGVKFDI